MLRVVCPGRCCNGIQLFWPRRLIAAESQNKVGWNPGQVLAKPSSFPLPLTLSRAHRRVPCHQIAQFLPDNGQVHRESRKSSLSVDASCSLRRLCISMATRETHFAHGETSNRHIIAIILMFASSRLEPVQKLAV
jgi:hypothetical protein